MTIGLGIERARRSEGLGHDGLVLGYLFDGGQLFAVLIRGATCRSDHHERERTERDDVERKHGANRCCAEKAAHNRAHREPDERGGGEQAEPRSTGDRRNDRRRSGIGSGHPAADRNPEDRRRDKQPPDIMHQNVEPAPAAAAADAAAIKRGGAWC